MADRAEQQSKQRYPRQALRSAYSSGSYEMLLYRFEGECNNVYIESEQNRKSVPLRQCERSSSHGHVKADLAT